jgi:hypothetical protein
LAVEELQSKRALAQVESLPGCDLKAAVIRPLDQQLAPCLVDVKREG